MPALSAGAELRRRLVVATPKRSDDRRALTPDPVEHTGMSLSADELREFKTRYEHVFNRRLSDDEALDLADRLEELYRIVLRRSAAPAATPRPVAPPWRMKSEPLSDSPDV